MQMYNSSRVVPIFVGSSPHPKIEGKKMAGLQDA